VLDIACGEGYGAAAFARAGAVGTIGVDRSPEVCDHARRKYGLDARPGDAQAIPLPDRSIDVVVSFETIEHVDDPAAFVGECARVLAPEGMLIVSTPNRPVYSGEGTQNPFHRIEFDEEEFLGLLRSKFRSVQLYTQFPRSAAWWSPRSLAAERSPWLRIRGFWRLSSWLCPAIRSHVDPAIRAKADEIILARDSFLSTLFNPYVVRPRSESSRERPYILIAVARGIV
jgi:SAM-dependent methyltransferase